MRSSYHRGGGSPCKKWALLIPSVADPQLGKDGGTTRLRRLHVEEESGQPDPWQCQKHGATMNFVATLNPDAPWI